MPRPVLFIIAIFLNYSLSAAEPKLHRYAEIKIVDEATNRGIPMVELETVNHIKYISDNTGRIAFLEPGLMNTEVFFSVRSHGYIVPKDGFGFAGVRITPNVEKPIIIKLKRKNIAERLCRLTGEGRVSRYIIIGPSATCSGFAKPRQSGRARQHSSRNLQGQDLLLLGRHIAHELPIGVVSYGRCNDTDSRREELEIGSFSRCCIRLFCGGEKRLRPRDDALCCEARRCDMGRICIYCER